MPPIGNVTARLRTGAALLAGAAAAEASRRLGRGGGTALPGLVAAAIAPDITEQLMRRAGAGTVVVTGTNGKTTTSHLLAEIARAAGIEVIANRSGSNLERGIVSAFLGQATNGAAARLGVLEVDEAALPPLLPALRPRAIVFLNLFRDQLDRYGEVDSVAEGWERMLNRRRLRSDAGAERGRPLDRAAGGGRTGRRGDVRHRGPGRRPRRPRSRLGCPLLLLRRGLPLRRDLRRSRRALALRLVRPGAPAPDRRRARDRAARRRLALRPRSRGRAAARRAPAAGAVPDLQRAGRGSRGARARPARRGRCEGARERGPGLRGGRSASNWAAASCASGWRRTQPG